jgi:hypothetical protein
MDFLALVVALAAVFAAIQSTISASVRDEAHNQVAAIQGFLKELSSLATDHFKAVAQPKSTWRSPVREIKSNQSDRITFECLTSLKLDLIESSIELLMRRCKSYFFFDADAKIFHVDFIRDIGDLRDALSQFAYSKPTAQDLYMLNAKLMHTYASLNVYIGERFRPVFETRDQDL